MTKLFNDVCDILEPLPFNYSDNKLEIQQEHKEWYFAVDRYDVEKSPENITKFLKVLRMKGHKGYYPRFSRIVDNRKTEYQKSGWKYTEELLDSQRLDGGELVSIVVDMGINPLYSDSTVDKARRVIEKLVRSKPAYWKIERNDNLRGNIHIHILILAPEGFKFPQRVNNYPVCIKMLGEDYPDKSMYENTRDFMMYLYKPADGRASFKSPGHVQQMYLEWWEEMLRREEGRPQWERVTLRGSLNLNIKWLKGFDREEIEERYISRLEESKSLLETIPAEENQERVKFFEDYLPTLDSFCCKGQYIPYQLPLGLLLHNKKPSWADPLPWPCAPPADLSALPGYERAG